MDAWIPGVSRATIRGAEPLALMVADSLRERVLRGVPTRGLMVVW